MLTPADRHRELETALGHTFQNPKLLEEALTHASVLGQGRRGERARTLHYERLEFLGDRVLGLLVAEMLLQQFPKDAEGQLARRFAALVQRTALAEVAEAIGLPHCIRLTDVEQPGARANPTLLSDVCEAVIGALYLDGGLEVARQFVVRHWKIAMEAAESAPKDPKTALQEWVQARGLKLPQYQVTGCEGPPHDPVFTVSVEIEGLPPATATGHSKREAEVSAARALLAHLPKPERP